MCLLCQEIKYVSRIVELKTEDIVGHNTVKTRKKFLISKAEGNRSGVQGSAFKGYRFDENLYIFTTIRP